MEKKGFEPSLVCLQSRCLTYRATSPWRSRLDVPKREGSYVPQRILLMTWIKGCTPSRTRTYRTRRSRLNRPTRCQLRVYRGKSRIRLDGPSACDGKGLRQTAVLTTTAPPGYLSRQGFRPYRGSLLGSGGGGWIRTNDLRLMGPTRTTELLYSASRGDWTRTSVHTRYERVALAICATPRGEGFIWKAFLPPIPRSGVTTRHPSGATGTRWHGRTRTYVASPGSKPGGPCHQTNVPSNYVPVMGLEPT